MPVRAYGSHPFFYAADFRYFSGNFYCRENAALARLGALTQLELDHFHLFEVAEFTQFVVTEISVAVSNAVFRGTDLKDNVAPAFQMPGRQSAFAGIQPVARHARSVRQRKYRRFRYRAIAHRRHVDDRHRLVRLPGIRADDERTCWYRIDFQCWEGAIDKYRRAGRRDIER